MAPELQTKLLRFTQDRMLSPVGGARARRIDTRIVAATSRTGAADAVGELGLRADLAARLGAEPIRIPPLRERIEDLGALARYLLGEREKPLELPAFQALCLYAWPGNVRELGKVDDRRRRRCRAARSGSASSTCRRRSLRRPRMRASPSGARNRGRRPARASSRH